MASHRMIRKWPIKFGLGFVIFGATFAAVFARAQDRGDAPAVEIKAKHPLPQPPIDPASCGVAHQRAAMLLIEFQTTVPKELRDLIEDDVAHRDPACSVAKAWDDSGAAMYLMGDARAASWCGLNAIANQWTGQFVTNCGVYLIHVNKLDDALALLNCAYASGYRSPYLFEALSTLFHLRGEKDKAIQEIELAEELAPDDPAIIAEASIAKTGGPPPPSPPTNNAKDGLDGALAEFHKHVQDVIEMIKRLAAQIDRAENNDPQTKPFRDQQLAITCKGLETQADFVDQAAGRARQTREETAQQMHMKADSQQFDGVYQTMQRMNWNQAIASCILQYMRTTDELLCVFADKDVDSPGFHLLLWADVLYMDPTALAQEQRLRWDDISQRHAISSQERVGGFNDLCHSFRIQYQADQYAAGRDWKEGFDACNTIKEAEAARACHIRNDAKHCMAMREIYERWAQSSKERNDLAAHHFEYVAQGTMDWGQRQVLDSRDYGMHYFKSLHFLKDEPHNIPMPDGTKSTESDNYKRMVNVQYNSILKRLLDPKHATWSIAKRLRQEGEWFTRQRASTEEELAREKAGIEKGGSYNPASCAEVMAKYLELLAEEAWKEYLNSLSDKMKGDFQAEYDPTMNCGVTLGPWSIGIDDTGKVTEGFKHGHKVFGQEGGTGVTFENGEFAGASYGAGISESGGGLTGSGDATVFVGKEPFDRKVGCRGGAHWGGGGGF